MYAFKASYKDDQWSPLNPQGKKQYDRDFLLALQSHPICLCKPSTLPNLDIIKERAHIQKLSKVNRVAPMSPMPVKAFDPFMPTYARAGNALRPPHPTINRRSQQVRNTKPNPKSFSLDRNVQLHESENAWHQSYKVEHTPDETAELETEVIEVRENRAVVECEKVIFEKNLPEKNISEECLKNTVRLLEADQQNLRDTLAAEKQKSESLQAEVEELKLQIEDLHQKLNVIENTNNYLNKRIEELKKLECTVVKVILNSDISIDEMRAKLKELLSENRENEDILDWIDAKVPPSAVKESVFIRALAQEVHKASIIETGGKYELDQATLKKRLPLLTRFINHKEYLELQALYAVQHLMNDLNQPKGVLRQIFDVLYDDDVIVEETFKTWEQCEDPTEKEGKDVALMSVRGFFTWLRPNQRHLRPAIPVFSPSSKGIILHVSENAWRPSFKVEHSPGEGTALEELTKRVRGILNKLTPQNFQTLVSQVRHELGINTEEKLEILVNLIFENALNAPKYCVPFANMCKSLALIHVPQEGSRGMVQFRKLLLTKCQHEFEKDRKDELQREERKNTIEAADADKKMQMEFEQQKKKIRMRQLGNIRFIGELFKLGMLIEPIMHECIKKLLSQGDEESLECLCRLLKTIGKELEEKGSKNLRDVQNVMDQYFDEIQKIVDRKMTSSRLYFMLQDVIDLRKDNWIPRRDEDYPKTIDQIHKEAEIERLNPGIFNVREAQGAYLNMSYSNECSLDDRRKLRGDGWSPISNRNVGCHSDYSEVDPSKSKLVEKHEFTVGEVNSKSDISIDKIKDKLKELLSENRENETIFDWIDANVPPSAVTEPVFIRALALEVCKASIIESDKEKKLDQDTLKKRLPLLTRFIDHNNYLELQALYAVQHLLNDLNQPKGVLRQIFDLLYDDDVITGETFKMWEQCKDPSEQEGKEVALMSVRGFFTWLREAESEEGLENE